MNHFDSESLDCLEEKLLLFQIETAQEVIADARQLQNIEGGIPMSWLNLVNQLSSQAIFEIWEKAAVTLPRFSKYISQSTTGVVLLSGDLGAMLAYQLRDWEEVSPGEIYEKGIMIAGMPTTQKAIEEFEGKRGRLPAELKMLWKIHSFMSLKGDILLSSLDEDLLSFCGNPIFLGIRKDPWNSKDEYECLAIADVMGDFPLCLTRKPGEDSWDNFIVNAYKERNSIIPSSRRSIEELITDWEFGKWE